MDTEPQENLELEATPEEKAGSTGWVPQAEWVEAGKDAEDWVSAREYNRVGEMMDRMRSQSSQIKGLEKKLNQVADNYSTLSEHHSKVKETAYEDALKEVKELKKDALEIGDYDTVIEADEKLLEIRQDHANALQAPSQAADELPPAVQGWIDENDWYGSDAALRGAMDALVSEELDRDPRRQSDPLGLLTEVSNKLKQEFPAKFGRQARPNSSMVTEPGDGATSSATKGKKFTQRHLNPEQLRVGKRLVETGGIESLNVYAVELGKLQDLDTQKGI